MVGDKRKIKRLGEEGTLRLREENGDKFRWGTALEVPNVSGTAGLGGEKE